MFIFNDLPATLEPSLHARLLQAEPTNIGHFLEWGFMDTGIRAMQQDVKIAGPAVTVHCPSLDGTIVAYALGQVRPGDVLVIDRCGDLRHSCFGGMVAYAAKVAGVAGVIIDGVVADIGEIRECGLPIWCRGLSPITTRRLGLSGSFCEPISCGNVTVRPGDIILADEVGVVVLDPKDAEAAADMSIKMTALEHERRRRLDSGEKLPDLNGATDLIKRVAQKPRADFLKYP